MKPSTLIAELQHKGLTQMEIAAGAGVNQATVSRYATGVITRVPYETIQKLLKMRERIATSSAK